MESDGIWSALEPLSAAGLPLSFSRDCGTVRTVVTSTGIRIHVSGSIKIESIEDGEGLDCLELKYGYGSAVTSSSDSEAKPKMVQPELTVLFAGISSPQPSKGEAEPQLPENQQSAAKPRRSNSFSLSSSPCSASEYTVTICSEKLGVHLECPKSDGTIESGLRVINLLNEELVGVVEVGDTLLRLGDYLLHGKRMEEASRAISESQRPIEAVFRKAVPMERETCEPESLLSRQKSKNSLHRQQSFSSLSSSSPSRKTPEEILAAAVQRLETLGFCESKLPTSASPEKRKEISRPEKSEEDDGTTIKNGGKPVNLDILKGVASNAGGRVPLKALVPPRHPKLNPLSAIPSRSLSTDGVRAPESPFSLSSPMSAGSCGEKYTLTFAEGILKLTSCLL